MAYNVKYDAEMSEIKTHEAELKRILTIRARHLKETAERKVELSMAKVTHEKLFNAETIRLEDRECDYRTY